MTHNAEIGELNNYVKVLNLRNLAKNYIPGEILLATKYILSLNGLYESSECNTNEIKARSRTN